MMTMMTMMMMMIMMMKRNWKMTMVEAVVEQVVEEVVDSLFVTLNPGVLVFPTVALLRALHVELLVAELVGGHGL